MNYFYPFLPLYASSCFMPLITKDLFIYTFKQSWSILVMDSKANINYLPGKIIFGHEHPFYKYAHFFISMQACF